MTKQEVHEKHVSVVMKAIGSEHIEAAITLVNRLDDFYGIYSKTLLVYAEFYASLYGEGGVIPTYSQVESEAADHVIACAEKALVERKNTTRMMKNQYDTIVSALENHRIPFAIMQMFDELDRIQDAQYAAQKALMELREAIATCSD